MIGIYQDNFVDYLEDKLGYTKETSKNIITKCPWCEFNEDKSHYHMYISLEAPIFHCFHATCEQSGTLRKLLKRIEGHDISDKFIDSETLNNIKRKREVFIDKDQQLRQIYMPALNVNKFPNKDMYIKRRLRFANIPSNEIKGLVYDVEEFIKQNHIPVEETLFRLQDYLQTNFVGFLTEQGTTVVFRNIDNSHSMRYYKMKIQFSNFLDYYKLPGNDAKSKTVVLAEGIFDIFSEHIYDKLNLKNQVKLYASALSSKYIALIHSVIFNEQIFKPEIIILSDNGIPLDDYKKMKKYNRHIVDTMSVYYNKTGKDFGEAQVTPVKYVV